MSPVNHTWLMANDSIGLPLRQFYCPKGVFPAQHDFFSIELFRAFDRTATNTRDVVVIWNTDSFRRMMAINLDATPLTIENLHCGFWHVGRSASHGVFVPPVDRLFHQLGLLRPGGHQ
jgi:hypothetical protein